jgi:hypothetical protein
MPGGAAPDDNLLIPGSQRDPLADRCCHGASPGSPGLIRYRRGPEQQESRSHARAGTIRAIVLSLTVRPIRQGGKRCGSPGKTPATASPGGRAACPVVRSCRRTSRAGHWLRVTVGTRSGVLAGARRLDPRHGRGGPAVSARRRYAICLRRMAGRFRRGPSMVSNPPEIADASPGTAPLQFPASRGGTDDRSIGDSTT